MTHDARAWKAAWPLLLCAASAGVTLACVRMSDSNREKHMGQITIEHIHIETEKPFGEVTAALEARMGKFDPAVYEELRSGADPEAVRARLEDDGGPAGCPQRVELTSQMPSRVPTQLPVQAGRQPSGVRHR